ncbi:class I SAM-dependent methyltransferase [Gammaproteobacteria bacterium]|nr:class I SAM-dependent methyltransferase [Gammaproteobacteria bacterium]
MTAKSMSWLARFLEGWLSRIRVAWFKRRFNIIVERLKGLDYSSTINQAHLGLSSNSVNRGSPSPSAALKEVVKRLHVNESDRLLDVGCAKGYALSFFLQHLDCKVAGLEISEKLANICRHNIRRQYGLNIPVYNEDAARFEAFGEFNYFYMYNPFPNETILDTVVSQIVSQSRQNAIIIYYNPQFENVILKKGFVLIDDIPIAGLKNKRLKFYEKKYVCREKNL